MKFSILVTAYDPENKLTEMTDKCLTSIKECSVGEDYELLVDTGPVGLFGAYNRLFKRAKGDYFVVVPNDTIIRDKDWLKILPNPDRITSWHIGIFMLTGNREPDGGVTCYPRKLVEKIGYYDEQFDEGYGFGDNDYFHRATLLGIEPEERFTNIVHQGGKTYEAYFNDKKPQMYLHCQELFKKKWNIK